VPLSFTSNLGCARVVFGSGAVARLADEIASLGLSRVLVVCTPRRRALAERLTAELGNRACGIFAEAQEHVPDDVAVAARRALDHAGADGVLALGGGSAIGVAKSTALGGDVRIVAVPTTYSGSEMTELWGVTRGGEKVTGKDARVRPTLVVYDPELTLDLPAQASTTSGFNALAHCVEALYAKNADPLAQLAAERGARALAQSLPILASNPRDLEAREAALLGAYLGGVSLSAGIGLHHKLCHVLGGAFGLPHAATHAVLLPHVVAFNADAAPEAMQRLALALGASDAIVGVVDLLVRSRCPQSLAELGFSPGDVDRAADLAVAHGVENPRPVSREAVRELLARALAGPPRATA
jgi:maleylacetate reductase